jgi:hypothetical protein
MAWKPAARAKSGRGPGRWTGAEGAYNCRQVRLGAPAPSWAPRARPWDRSTRRGCPVTLGLGAVGEGRNQGTRKSGAEAAARGPPWHPTGRPRGTGAPTSFAQGAPSGPVGGSRRCPLPASLEGVGVGPAGTNRAGQSPVPGTDPPERNRRVKSRTAVRRKSPRRTRGAQDQGGRTDSPRNHPTLHCGPGRGRRD